MIIGRDFVLIGMPKCGCIFSKYMLKGAGLIEEFISHTPISQIPAAKKAGKRIIGMVRNPFAWYVSRWADVQAHYAKQDGPMEFEPWLRKYLYQPKSAPMMSVCREFPDPKTPLGTFTYTHVCFHCEAAAVLLSGGDVNDWEVWDYDDELSCAVMLKTETLSADVEKVYGPIVTAHLNAPRNSNPHRPYQEMYTPDLRKLVERADRLIFNRYEYYFDGA